MKYIIALATNISHENKGPPNCMVHEMLNTGPKGHIAAEKQIYTLTWPTNAHER